MSETERHLTPAALVSYPPPSRRPRRFMHYHRKAAHNDQDAAPHGWLQKIPEVYTPSIAGAELTCRGQLR
ncbi:hypothetical protein [Streptomyces chartreusis]|uniref:hypothetical protein n=1 Tax=Streptomyces chartreusis TaxID=1969 RepID=UPI00369B7184